MAKTKNTRFGFDVQEPVGQNRDGLKSLLQEVIQEIHQTEMNETVGAESNERRDDRIGYRAGY